MKKALALLLSIMMIASMAACASTPAAPASSAAPAPASSAAPAPAASSEAAPAAPAAGTGTGSAKGFGGEITATVTMNGDKIEKIEVVGKDETPGIGAVAVEKLPANMLKNQTVNVDAMAGATVSSKAIIEAVSAAITAAGADLSKYQGSVAAAGNGAAETVDVDVVVIGSGGAGMAAAIEAKAAGKNVVIVEKMAMMGGNTSKATGGMNAAETSVQKAAGVEDSVQLMIDDAMKGGGNINDIKLVTAMAERSASAIDWLASVGAPLPDLTTLAASSAKRAHRPEGGGAVGSYLVGKLSAYVEEKGIPVYLNTKATELIAENGAVVGVKAEGEGKAYTFNSKAVVLATGGFGANEDIYTKYRPELKGFVTTNTPGSTGDGIVMAEAVGASLTDIEQIQIHPTVHQATSIMITEGLRGDGAILVNKEGKRFVNEMETRANVSAAELKQTDGCAYILFDQALRERVKAVESYVKNNILIEGATIEELAKNINVDPAVLKETIDKWNKVIADKNDPEFGRATGLDYEIAKGPFYVSLIAPGVHHTMGGVTINTNTEVINTSGNVIPGLFAAGEVTGGIHGNNRLGGNAVADIIIFGRQAGQSAAAFADKAAFAKAETVKVDIAVIGSGGAGMAAAIEAKAAGKNVVIIEKMAMMGGNTIKATGGMNAAETSVQKAAGVEDSVQLMIDDAMKGGGNINDIKLVTAMAERSASAIDWLASVGAPLPDLTTLAASSAKRAHRPEGGGAVGTYLVGKLSAYVQEKGIPVYLNTKAVELTTADGAVTGVKALGEDKAYVFEAKAVVLATGGFGANEAIYTKYRPELKGFVTTNTPGATGDGIVMAEAVGASLTDIEQIQIHPTVHQATSIMITEGLRGDGAILVNKEGKRFVNEMETRANVSAAELKQTDGCAYILFDQALRERVKAVEGYVKNNILIEGATIEELAKNINVDPAVLKETIDTWNKVIADKNDPAFGRATGLEYDISKGPFYVSLIAPGVHHTMGGVTINTNAEVISTSGNVISGLYAAGEVTGGIHGNNRLGGNAVADIIIFGRQAGQSAAAFVG